MPRSFHWGRQLWDFIPRLKKKKQQQQQKNSTKQKKKEEEEEEKKLKEICTDSVMNGMETAPRITQYCSMSQCTLYDDFPHHHL